MSLISKGVRFIRRGGRIIPIKAKQASINKKSKSANVLNFKKPSKKSLKRSDASIPDIGIALFGSIAIGTAAQKLRQLSSEKATGKKSLGNPLSNLVADSVIAGTSIRAVSKRSESFRLGLNAILRAGRIKK